jgi:hypothetical protein
MVLEVLKIGNNNKIYSIMNKLIKGPTVIGKIVRGKVIYYTPRDNNNATSRCEMCGSIKYTSECACEC